MTEFPIQLDTYSTELAPDGTVVIPLTRTSQFSTCHATLAPNQISNAVVHKHVEESWYVLSGEGEFYCAAINAGRPFELRSGTCFIVPRQSGFQLRNINDAPLCCLITTAPAWPGEDEALPASGPWQPNLDAPRPS